MLENAVSYKHDFDYRSLARMEHLPPLPKALERLITIIQDEGATVENLEAVIQCDQGLAAKVLQIANSSYYGTRSKVATLSRAIMTMGFHEVKSICLCFMLMEHFSGEAETRVQRRNLWKHSISVAVFARDIVEGRPWIKKEEAYTLGLLHDLGYLVMMTHFQNEYRMIEGYAREMGISLWEAETSYGITHTQVGKWASIRWALPPIYRHVMAFHHFPWNSPACQPVVKVVYLADLLARLKEYPEGACSESVERCLKELYLSQNEWENHLNRVDAAWEEVGKIWKWLG